MGEYYKIFIVLGKMIEYSCKVKNNAMIYIYKFTEQQNYIKVCHKAIIFNLRDLVLILHHKY